MNYLQLLQNVESEKHMISLFKTGTDYSDQSELFIHCCKALSDYQNKSIEKIHNSVLDYLLLEHVKNSTHVENVSLSDLITGVKIVLDKKYNDTLLRIMENYTPYNTKNMTFVSSLEQHVSILKLEPAALILEDNSISEDWVCGIANNLVNILNHSYSEQLNFEVISAQIIKQDYATIRLFIQSEDQNPVNTKTIEHIISAVFKNEELRANKNHDKTDIINKVIENFLNIKNEPRQKVKNSV